MPVDQSFNAPLSEVDPEIAAVLEQELGRQRGTLEMIASENFVPRAVLQSQGSVLTNKYAEGYPGRRYYGGCEFVDVAEQLAIDRAKSLFGAEFANVQPHSGATANAAVLAAIAQPGDMILGLELAHGGHLTHGMKLNFSGKLYDAAAYGVDPDTFLIDMDVVREKALAHRPQVIIAGWSAYPRHLDFAAFRSIADEVGAKLWVDMAHFAGLVAAGVHPSPVPYADVVSSTVHKTLAGPRSGVILSRDTALAKKLNSAVFPGQQGGPLMHVIAAKATAFKIAATEEFADRQRRTIQGAQILAEAPRRGRLHRGRRLGPHGRHGRAPRARGSAELAHRRQAGGGRAARGRHHGQPQLGAVRPAPADGHLRRPHRHVRARDPRLRRDRVHGGGGHHRRDPEARQRPRRPACARAHAHRRLPALRGPHPVTAVVLDGVATASAVKSELAVRIRALREQGLVPARGTLLVGDDPGSRAYVAGKHRDCAEVGIESIRVDLPADATEADVRLAIERLNSDPAVTGYIVQLPLPAGIDENAMLELIDPSKDADGLHPTNLGRLVLGVQGELTSPLPCTPAGIVEMLQRYEVPIAGQHVVVVGRGLTVGRPLGLLLTRKGLDATVTLTHSRTRDLEQEVRRADIVVAAVGVAHLIKPEWVKPGAAVLDVGITRVVDPETGKARLTGDVDPAVAEVAGHLSPNPRGVGPMTRAMLLANVVQAAERDARLAAVLRG